MNVVELFSGSGTISKAFKERGHKIFSIDIRRRKGICEPDLRKDIMKVRLKDIPFKKVDVVWASPPCDVFSKAGANFHWNRDGTPRTEKCLAHICLLRKTIKLIEKIRPEIFFIENPDGKMKYRKELVTFLIRYNSMTKKVYYSDYGFPTRKPTNIFTNALSIRFRNIQDIFKKSPLQGSKKTRAHESKKTNSNVFNNLTTCQRQSIPEELAKEIVKYCEDKIQ